MATKLTFRLAGFRELRTAPKVRADLLRRAQRIAAASGKGFVALETSSPRKRARAAVVAASEGARHRNATQNTLLRNLDKGRS